MAAEFEMRLTTVDGSTGVRAVYLDEDGDEYVIVDNERYYLDPEVREAMEDDDGQSDD